MAKIIGYDATGYEVLTKAIAELLNTYPGLDGRIITFEELEPTKGICFSADNGAMIISEKRDILDHVTQTCQYPFFVVYRSAAVRSAQKMNVQAFLDTLGKWLCKEVAVIGENEYKISGYPDLTGDRKIRKITRSNSYGTEPSDKGVEDWLLPVTVEYTYEFDDTKGENL